MPTTQELIEKYKSEMKQMISKANINKLPPLENNVQTEIFSPAEMSESEAIFEPEVRTQPEVTTKPEVRAEPQPMRSQLQNESENRFPEFVNRGDELTRRIEEILMHNSDVVLESDMPKNIGTTDIPIQMQSEISPAIEESTQQRENFVRENEQNEQPAQRNRATDSQRNNNSPPANTGSIAGNNASSTAQLGDTANLIIDVFTANRAIPIPNAVVRIKNPDDNSVLAVLNTDENGATTQIQLAAPSGELSQSPQNLNPFVNYYADIRADGFIPQSDLRIQLFGGQNTRLPANLIPREEI